jgi:hypothetical protein
MIRPLRRYHRRLIAAIVVTLTIAALFTITHQAPDVRMETLPASLLPIGADGPMGEAVPAKGAAR